jgi:hypothetical protein
MTEPKLEVVKFGKFRITREARKILSRLTEYDGQVLGTWLRNNGKSVRRDPVGRVSSRILDGAEVKLGFTRMRDVDDRPFSATPFSALVPYRATRQQIEEGWMEVAWAVYLHEARQLARGIANNELAHKRFMKLAGPLLEKRT